MNLANLLFASMVSVKVTGRAGLLPEGRVLAIHKLTGPSDARINPNEKAQMTSFFSSSER